MCLFSWARLPLYSSPFAHPHHSTLPPPSHRCHLQLPQQKCLPVCLNVSLWSGTSPLAPGGPHTHTHHLSPMIGSALTILIKLVKQMLTSGDGKFVGMPSPRGEVMSALPRMELMWRAMTSCCSTLQWFSKERITGYWDVWGKAGNPPQNKHISVLLDVEWRHAGYQQMLNIPWRHAHWWLWSHL